MWGRIFKLSRNPYGLTDAREAALARLSVRPPLSDRSLQARPARDAVLTPLARQAWQSVIAPGAVGSGQACSAALARHAGQSVFARNAGKTCKK